MSPRIPAVALCAVLVTAGGLVFPRDGRAEDTPTTDPATDDDEAAATEARRAAESELSGELRKLVAQKDYREILRTADDALRDRADSVPAWSYRGFALQRMGRKTEAVTAYRRAVALDRSNAWALTQLGHLLSELGRPDEAADALTHAALLEPASVDTQRKLSWVLRDLGRYDEAVRSVTTALEAGVDGSWAHAELGYLHWVRGDAAASRRHWDRAAKYQADAVRVSHGLQLLAWDRELAPARRNEAAGPNGIWTFGLGRHTYETAVGPRLPARLAKQLASLEKQYHGFLRLGDRDRSSVRIILSRTLEEHERHRRVLFPAGSRGRAFLNPVPVAGTGGRRGRGGWGRGAMDWRLDVYVAWSEPALETSLSHELGHAHLHHRVRNLPAWLDEGVATYLEVPGGAGGRAATGEVRSDLLRSLSAAYEAGTALTFRQVLTLPRNRFDGPGARARYAEAWSLVHFLLHRGEPGDDDRFFAFLDALASPRERPLDAFRKSYGNDLNGLETQWRAHLTDMGVELK